MTAPPAPDLELLLANLLSPLADARRHTHLSLPEVAARLGMSAKSVRDWEAGIAMPSLPALLKWARSMAAVPVLCDASTGERAAPAPPDGDVPSLCAHLVARAAARREELGISRVQVARVAGVSASAVYWWDTGRALPPVPRALAYLHRVDYRLSFDLPARLSGPGDPARGRVTALRTAAFTDLGDPPEPAWTWRIAPGEEPLLRADLVRERRAAGLTQTAAARDIGISQPTLSAVETGRAAIRPGQVAMMLRLYRAAVPGAEPTVNAV